MGSPKVFISFDFDRDEFLRSSFVGQCKNTGTPFQIEDWSVKEPWPQQEWEERCSTKIRHCDLVLVMVGEKTYSCTGVKTEIRLAQEAGIPVVAIKGYSNRTCPKPEGVQIYLNWTWPNVKHLIENYSKKNEIRTF